jgi:uncharacterized protein YxeA
MKKYLIIILINCSILCSCNTSTNNNKNKEDELLKNHTSTSVIHNPRSATDTSAINELGKLTFTDTLHAFGNVTEGETVEYTFDFTNSGSKGILITEAKASCGCTVADYPKDVINPGDKNNMKVTFNSQGKSGFNEKNLTIRTNGNPANYTLTITATVNKK